MDVHGTRRVGWETFASCFTRPGSHPHSPPGGGGSSAGEELSPMRFGETKQHLDFLQKIQAPGQPRPAPRESNTHASQRRPNDAPNNSAAPHRRRQRPNESGHARRGEEKAEAQPQPTVSVLAGKGGRQLLTQVPLRCAQEHTLSWTLLHVCLLAWHVLVFTDAALMLCVTTDAPPTAPSSEIGSSACSTSCVCLSAHGSRWLGFASPLRPPRQEPRWVRARRW